VIERVSKRIDFAKKRKAQGRALSAAVHEIAGLIQSVAQRNGIDLQARLNEASARKSEERRLLAERLQESVVPLFIDDSGGHPERIGSCVLVRLNSDLFAFSAAHVIREAASARILAPSGGRGGKLLPLPVCTAHLSSQGSHDDLDVGVLVLPSRQLGPFQQRVFLSGPEIDQNDQPDNQEPASFYFVLGYPASRAQVSRVGRHFKQRSFQFSTSPVDAAEYLQERMPQADHILLDFDHKHIMVEGRRVNPPRLQGVSGGGVFYISRRTYKGPLVAIATKKRRNSGLIVGTRIKHFLTMVRELKTKPKRSESK
jgi:hypothetical protein